MTATPTRPRVSTRLFASQLVVYTHSTISEHPKERKQERNLPRCQPATIHPPRQNAPEQSTSTPPHPLYPSATSTQTSTAPTSAPSSPHLPPRFHQPALPKRPQCLLLLLRRRPCFRHRHPPRRNSNTNTSRSSASPPPHACRRAAPPSPQATTCTRARTRLYRGAAWVW